MRIHINIGSNQGDRRALIGQAVALIASAWPDARMRLSRPVESEPWGYESPNRFLNLGVMLDTDALSSPHDVLRRLLAIERRVGGGAPHRGADGDYCDRPVDIDLIAVDRLCLSTPDLTLPHPRARLRPFVMHPLHELDPLTASWLESL